MLTLAVASGKGGVGKSTIATLLAQAFKKQGAQVALLDTDIFGPSVPTLLGIQGQRHTFNSHQRIVPIKTYGIEVVSFEGIIGEAPAIMRGPMVARYTEQLLTQVAWSNPDILILDMPPGTGDIHLSITQNMALHGALLVSTPHSLSYSDVGKAMIMFNKVKIPVLGLIENMAFFRCPKCNTNYYPFGKEKSTVLTRRFGIPVMTRFPISEEDFARLPLPETPYEGIMGLIESIKDSLAKEERRPIPRITTNRQGISLIIGKKKPLFVSHLKLRNACQCALCVDSTGRRVAPVVTAAITAQELKLVGNYALYVKWSDGHATGFFPLEQISELAKDTKDDINE